MDDSTGQTVGIPSVSDITKLPTPPVLACDGIGRLAGEGRVSELLDDVAALGAVDLVREVAKEA